MRTSQRTHFGVSACCSLDAFLRRAPIPSPSLPDRPGFRRADVSHQAHNHPGVYQPGPTPRILQPDTAPAGAEGMQPWPPDTPPRSGACTGGSPTLVTDPPISVSKRAI